MHVLLLFQSAKVYKDPTGKVSLKFWLEGGPITCIRKHMKKVVFYELQGSRNEVVFLKFIAERAEMLEKMVIVVSYKFLTSGVDVKATLKPLTCAKWANGDCELQVFKSTITESGGPVYDIRLASESTCADPFDQIYYDELL